MSSTTTTNPKKSRIRQVGLGLVLLALVYVIFMRANPPAEETKAVTFELHFKKSDYGDAWPFRTIESGTVYCTEDKAVLFRDDQTGQIYGLNGWANTLARQKGYNWNNLDKEHIQGKDIGPMLDAGNRLCKK